MTIKTEPDLGDLVVVLLAGTLAVSPKRPNW